MEDEIRSAEQVAPAEDSRRSLTQVVEVALALEGARELAHQAVPDVYAAVKAGGKAVVDKVRGRDGGSAGDDAAPPSQPGS